MARKSTSANGSKAPIVAAGAVVVRRVNRTGGEVLLVHRPGYDDWSWPKGKQDPGEHLATTAWREVEEETGLRVTLGRPLPQQQYRVGGGRMKHVHWWQARARGSTDVSGYRPNKEIDRVEWLSFADARKRLTYADDREILEEVVAQPRRTRVLAVLRHARARKRAKWSGPDHDRPLTRTGQRQAAALPAVLRAFQV